MGNYMAIPIMNAIVLFENVMFVLAALIICILGVIIFMLRAKIRSQKNQLRDYSNLQEKYQKVTELSRN